MNDGSANRGLPFVAVALAAWLCACAPVHAASGTGDGPVGAEIIRVLLLRDYNTRLVVVSTAVLGLAAGLIGSFLLLRKRALVGDALSHAALPGIGIAFIAMVRAGGTGKWLPGLLLGALISGLLGMGLIVLIRRWTLLQDDAALGIVLSVFFGCGIAVLGFVQTMPQGSAAGLESFIYGKTASMVKNDFLLISGVGAAAALACVLMFKEFRLLCFDAGFAAAQGWPVTALDMTMLLLVAMVTVVGLQSVGLILIIALLIIPPAAARFWTEKLSRMMVIAALLGGASGWAGASFSALTPRWPAGAVIVVVAASFFFVSMIFGASRGVLLRLREHWQLSGSVARQHLLRTLYEAVEGGLGWPPERVAGNPVSTQVLETAHTWSVRRRARLLQKAKRAGRIETTQAGVSLTTAGAKEAAQVVRNHRLWELYLLRHADIATSHVDSGADRIEHILGTDLVRQLEQELTDAPGQDAVPRSPHPIGDAKV